MKKMTVVSINHYFRLVYRSALLVTALGKYIYNRIHHLGTMLDEFEKRPLILTVIWIVIAVEMVLRSFPSRLESPGCQKQFARNMQYTGNTDFEIPDNNATVLVLLLWIALNGAFGALYLLGIFDSDVMLLICLAYSVCDLICILFFCPFQSWFLKNKCCVTCRIYNWDYAMMFTPLFFVPRIYTWSLLIMALLLLLRWELTVWLHPARFSEKTNAYLNCSNCPEKLCSHKTQLRRLWKRIEKTAKEKLLAGRL